MTFEGMSEDNRRQLMIVTTISLGMFIIEALAGQLAGSQSLKADALDFVAHGITYALAFWAIGRPMPARLAAAIVKAGCLVAMGLWVAATTLYHFFVPAPPDAGIMAFIGLVGLGANAITLGTLFVQRGDGGAIGSVWLEARNDTIGNAAVIVAAGLVAILGNGAPDLIVAGVMVALFLTSAVQMLRQAMTEWRELKEADAFPHREPSTPPDP
jgi:Co/Zn/Cd efflux system component